MNTKQQILDMIRHQMESTVSDFHYSNTKTVDTGIASVTNAFIDLEVTGTYSMSSEERVFLSGETACPPGDIHYACEAAFARLYTQVPRHIYDHLYRSIFVDICLLTDLLAQHAPQALDEFLAIKTARDEIELKEFEG